MGAHDFCDEGYGKNPNEVFRALCKEATWERGHDPYNGTISTNDSFVMIDLPPRVTTDKAQDLWAAWWSYEDAERSVRELQDSTGWRYKQFKSKAERSKALTSAKRRLRAAEKSLGKHKELARRLNRTIHKWGPCVCVERKGSELKRWKDARPHLKGKRGIRSFVFFGLAAC